MHIEGERVLIKTHAPENLMQMFAWSRDRNLIAAECGDVSAITNNLDQYRVSVFEPYLRDSPDARNTFCHFAVHKKADGALIGYADLLNISDAEKSAELSLSIPNAAERNHGYGFEACCLVLRYAFTVRGLSSVTIRTRAENTAMQRICARLGAQCHDERVTLHGTEYRLAVARVSRQHTTAAGLQTQQNIFQT